MSDSTPARSSAPGNGGGLRRPRRVLFVCLGNICRSPAAEAVLRTMVEARGLSAAVQVDSAGTSSYHVGEGPDPRMALAAGARGHRVAGRARGVDETDFREFDLIVAMDRSNLRDLEAHAGHQPGQICLLSEFLDETWPQEVPDPYYGGEEGFERVLDMLEAACPEILARLLADA